MSTTSITRDEPTHVFPNGKGSCFPEKLQGDVESHEFVYLSQKDGLVGMRNEDAILEFVILE